MVPPTVFSVRVDHKRSSSVAGISGTLFRLILEKSEAACLYREDIRQRDEEEHDERSEAQTDALPLIFKPERARPPDSTDHSGCGS